MCRHSYVIVIGGGAALDMVGFAAATAHRGLRLIRYPHHQPEVRETEVLELKMVSIIW